MRGKRHEDGWLTAQWSKKERDLVFGFPRKCDGHLVYGAFSTTYLQKDFVTELKERGYDLTTLQFSVRRLPENGTASAPETTPEATPKENS